MTEVLLNLTLVIVGFAIGYAGGRLHSHFTRRKRDTNPTNRLYLDTVALLNRADRPVRPLSFPDLPRLMVLAPLLFGLAACDDTGPGQAPTPTAPAELETGIPASKFRMDVVAYTGESAMLVTEWKDKAPAVSSFTIEHRPLRYPAYQIPELGDDAALRQTWLAVREHSKVYRGTSTHNYWYATRVRASPFRAYSYRSHGLGGLYFETRDTLTGEFDRRTRIAAHPTRRDPSGDGTVIQGDYVIALGNGLFRVIRPETFEAEYILPAGIPQ